MPTLDIFNNDAFSVQSLTAAINTNTEGQSVPGLLDPLFDEEGVTTTTVSIEMENDQLFLVANKPRGGNGQVVVGNKRKLIPFNTLHLPERATILADEVQGVRSFGSETEVQTVQAIVNKRLAKMRRQIDATLSYHRIGAVNGKIYDADGTTELLDIYSAFGVTQQTQSMVLNTATTNVLQKIRDAQRKAEDALAGATPITGWIGLMGRGFYDAFVTHDKVEKAFDRWQDGAFLREDFRKGFTFGEVVWKEYYGKVGSTSFIDTDVAYLIPVTGEQIFKTWFAPADYMSTVNTLGLPYYAAQEPLDFNKGVALEAQSNPLTLCTRPRAIIKLTKGS